MHAIPCARVRFGPPVDVCRLLRLHVPAVRVSFDMAALGPSTMAVTGL